MNFGEPMDFIGQITVQTGPIDPWYQTLAGNLEIPSHFDRLSQEVDIPVFVVIICAYHVTPH